MAAAQVEKIQKSERRVEMRRTPGIYALLVSVGKYENQDFKQLTGYQEDLIAMTYALNDYDF